MKGTSTLSLRRRDAQSGTCPPAWFLFLGLSLALASCSSSSPSATSPDAGVNQHLTYQDQLGANAAVKPHQTVVLNAEPAKSTLPGSGPDAGYHEFPYEISNSGKYKFCIPDDDTHLTEIALYSSGGALTAQWKKGGPCTSVALVPGAYTMRVNLNSAESDPLIFLKPHDVTVTQIGTMAAASDPYNGQIPYNQFLNLKVDSLTDILGRNKTGSLKQWWGLSTTFPGKQAPSYFDLDEPRFHSGPIGTILDSKPVKEISTPGVSQWVAVNQEEGGKVSLIQAEDQKQNAVAVFRDICVETHKETRCEDECTKQCSCWEVTVCGQKGNVIGLLPSGAAADKNSWFSFTSTAPAPSFRLSDSGSALVNWYAGEWATGAGGSPVDFKVVVRTGLTSGTNYPAMLANEVALFDSDYGAGGFPADTQYWIISADTQDLSRLYDNIAFPVRTVIAGRGVRAQLFQYPNFQGTSAYVSPPFDREMLMTGTDAALLNSNTLGGSLRIETNTNTIPVNEYEQHIIVNTNTCIGCDLRGFDASTAARLSCFGPACYYVLTKLTFKDSDFSSANFTRSDGQSIDIYNNNFEDVNFTGANLANAYIGFNNFTNADLSTAVLTNAYFSYNELFAYPPFYNACPKFEYTDLTTVKGFDSYFPIGEKKYNAETWWNTQQKICRTSLAYAKVTQNLFEDKRLWQFVDAPGVDFSNMNLDGAVFAGSNLTNAIFKNASLKGTVFVKAVLTGADVSGADLTGARLEGANLTGVNLHKAKTLSKAVLSGARFDTPPNLSNLDMSGAILAGYKDLDAGLKYKNWDGHSFEPFSGVSINRAYMYNTKLNGANLSGADLGNVSWYGDQATGENAIMVDTYLNTADLPGLNLKKAHLQGADFSDAVLVKADLSTLSSTDYSFDGTHFNRANLKGANLSGANLKGASLQDAVIYTGAVEQTATVEVLDDPVRTPDHYKFFQVNYSATTAPAGTDGVKSCPSGASGPCGALNSASWVPSKPPEEPRNCKVVNNVLVCDSNRRPKQ